MVNLCEELVDLRLMLGSGVKSCSFLCSINVTRVSSKLMQMHKLHFLYNRRIMKKQNKSSLFLINISYDPFFIDSALDQEVDTDKKNRNKAKMMRNCHVKVRHVKD